MPAVGNVAPSELVTSFLSRRGMRAGGSLIQQFCTCTALVYSPDDSSSDGNATVVNSCRFLSPSGNYVNATSKLFNMEPPGHWTEQFDFPLAPAGSYNIIELGTDPATGIDYAVEYDCIDQGVFGVNYWCVCARACLCHCLCV